MLNPICIGMKTASAAQGAVSNVADSAFTTMSGWFATAAQSAATWLWRELDTATTLDLTSPALRTQLVATGAIATVLCLGLFLIQVITAALRREPGGLGRAVTGLFVSFVGSAIALATTQALLVAVDSLSAGLLSYTMHTNMTGLGQRLAVAQLANNANPAVSLLLALVVIAAVVIVWAAMMLRKVMLLIAAVLAPLAFAGATADITRGWVRKWIEFVAAMVVSKLLLVIILGIGLSIVDGAGQSGTGLGQTTTQLAGGALVLLLAGLSPWVAIRMFHFAGDTLHAAHVTSGQATSGARAAIAAPQKVAALSGQARSLTSMGAGMPSRRSAGNVGQPSGSGSGSDPDGSPKPTPPAADPGVSGGQGAAGGQVAAAGGAKTAGAAGSAGGAAAAATPAAPVLLAAAAAQAGMSAVRAASSAAQSAAESAGQAGQPAPPLTATQARQQPPQQPAPSPNPRA